MQTQQEGQAQGARKGEQHIEVLVVTTSGTYPLEGSDQVPIHQPVKILRKRAENAHRIFVAIRGYADKHLARSNIDTCRIGF